MPQERIRERAVDAFILKRTDYGEADQIITLFSKQEGKLRVLVKAAKLPTSKLQPLLQPLFETRVTLTGRKEATGLARVMGVQLIVAYSGILESEAKLAAWYVVAELLIRALPDSAPNEQLFFELEHYAQFLHATDLTADQVKQSVIQFQIKALASLGLGIRTAAPAGSFAATSAGNADYNLWFSLDRGGFVDDDSLDAIPVQAHVFQSFSIMAEQPYSQGVELEPAQCGPLSNLVNRFVIYQLEREIRSHRALAAT